MVGKHYETSNKETFWMNTFFCNLGGGGEVVVHVHGQGKVTSAEELGQNVEGIRCYSSSAANPSEGAWQKSKRGVLDSPASTEIDYPFYRR